jgi:6-phosphogluconolactonase
MKYTFLLLLFLFIGCTEKPKVQTSAPAQTITYDLFVGTYTQKEPHVDGKAEGIYRIQLDENLNEKSRSVIADVINPSFLAFGKNKKGKNMLFAVEETAPDGKVTSFSIEKDSVVKINSQSSEGGAPCHLVYQNFNQQGLLFVANYGGGNLTMFSIDDDGRIEKAAQNMKFEGKGLTSRQTSSHLHHVKISSNDNETIKLKAADLGTDIVYDIEVKKDLKLVRNQQSDIKTVAGAGPRHLAEGYDNIVLNELNSTVAVYEKNTNRLLQTLKTTPDEYKASNLTAEIVHNGQCLFVSNRGHNSIAVFKILENNQLEKVGIYDCKGNIPRHISVSHDNKYLFVANQNSDSIAIFSIDNNGALTFVKNINIKTPVCVLDKGNILKAAEKS